MVPLQGADAGSNPVQGIKAYNLMGEYCSDTAAAQVRFLLGLLAYRLMVGHTSYPRDTEVRFLLRQY